MAATSEDIRQRLALKSIQDLGLLFKSQSNNAEFMSLQEALEKQMLEILASEKPVPSHSSGMEIDFSFLDTIQIKTQALRDLSTLQQMLQAQEAITSHLPQHTLLARVQPLIEKGHLLFQASITESNITYQTLQNILNNFQWAQQFILMLEKMIKIIGANDPQIIGSLNTLQTAVLNQKLKLYQVVLRSLNDILASPEPALEQQLKLMGQIESTFQNTVEWVEKIQHIKGSDAEAIFRQKIELDFQFYEMHTKLWLQKVTNFKKPSRVTFNLEFYNYLQRFLTLRASSFTKKMQEISHHFDAKLQQAEAKREAKETHVSYISDEEGIELTSLGLPARNLDEKTEAFLEVRDQTARLHLAERSTLSRIREIITLGQENGAFNQRSLVCKPTAWISELDQRATNIDEGLKVLLVATIKVHCLDVLSNSCYNNLLVDEKAVSTKPKACLEQTFEICTTQQSLLHLEQETKFLDDIDRLTKQFNALQDEKLATNPSAVGRHIDPTLAVLRTHLAKQIQQLKNDICFQQTIQQLRPGPDLAEKAAQLLNLNQERLNQAQKSLPKTTKLSELVLLDSEFSWRRNQLEILNKIIQADPIAKEHCSPLIVTQQKQLQELEEVCLRKQLAIISFFCSRDPSAATKIISLEKRLSALTAIVTNLETDTAKSRAFSPSPSINSPAQLAGTVSSVAPTAREINTNDSTGTSHAAGSGIELTVLSSNV